MIGARRHRNIAGEFGGIPGMKEAAEYFHPLAAVGEPGRCEALFQIRRRGETVAG